MKITLRIISLLTLVAIIGSAETGFAAENALKETFKSALYGGAAGGLIGAAIIAFTKKPADHLDYIAYGTASGVIAGAAYGMVKTSQSLAEYENGKVRFAVPAVIPSVVEHPATRQTNITWSTNLFSGKFE